MVLKRLYETIGLQFYLLTDGGKDSEEDWRKGTSIKTQRPNQIGNGASPLDNTGPMPSEYLTDPYDEEAVHVTGEIVPDQTKARLSVQERTIWASAVVVSWSVAIVAVLKVLGIL